ncbi:MAG: sulfite exporter TauE/SafE family protein [Clostridia bacterium]|nr:sulfite exporter TauE/SafE family protein [Clostridia bacterium]
MNIAALLAGLFSGIIGGMGMGGGAVLIIYLSLFTDTPQLKAQGINLLFFIPIGLAALIIYAFKKQIKWKTVLPLSLYGIIGTFLGIMLTKQIGNNWLSKIFGIFLVLMALKEFFTKKTKTVEKDNKKWYTKNE